MGRPRKWRSDAERMRAKRAGEAAKHTPDPPTPGATVTTIYTDEAREQAIRDKWGYAASEKRTEAERHATADRIMEKLYGQDVPSGYRVADPTAEGGIRTISVGTREAHALMGRIYGEDEANRRGEAGEKRAMRIRRAEAYALWVFDGKPSQPVHPG